MEIISTPFDVSTLVANFNKKVDIKRIYNLIEKKYSLNEVTKYAIVGYFKRKKYVVLVTLSNEKIFVFSNKKDLEINGVYSYKDIDSFDFFEKNKKTSLVINCREKTINLKGVGKEEYTKLCEIFEEEKKNFSNTKIGQNIMNSFGGVSSMDYFKKRVLYTDEELKHNKEEELEKDDYDSVVIEEVKLNEERNKKPENKKSKRVVNDKIISSDTTLSSAMIFELLSMPDKKLPGGHNTILNTIAKKTIQLENQNPMSTHIDKIALTLSSLSKLNTVPVIAEFSSVNEKDKNENRLLFARNWIEFTKHNVKNKLLGVDEEGNGAYIDIESRNSTKKVHTYKGREYLINSQKRHGLRSGQTISAKEKKGLSGIDSLYRHNETGNKLDVNDYDGILFMGQKYYFNIMNEFSSLQRKYCRIIHHDWRPNGTISKTYEITFEDDLISYKVYNEKGQFIDDLDITSSNYDLRWLTFFKD